MTLDDLSPFKQSLSPTFCFYYISILLVLFSVKLKKNHFYQGRHVGLMFIGSFCHFLRLDTFLSPCLSPSTSIHGHWCSFKKTWWTAWGTRVEVIFLDWWRDLGEGYQQRTGGETGVEFISNGLATHTYSPHATGSWVHNFATVYFLK